MEVSRNLWSFVSSLILCITLVTLHNADVRENMSEATTLFSQRDLEAYRLFHDRENRTQREGLNIIAIYIDYSGTIRIGRVKIEDLSASWVLESPNEGDSNQVKSYTRLRANVEHFVAAYLSAESKKQHPPLKVTSPVKLERKMLRKKRKKLRVAEFIQQDKETEKQMEAAAIQRSKNMEIFVIGNYNIRRKSYPKLNSDSILNLMRDQIIMAKAYANIAKSNNESSIFNSLKKQSRASQRAIGNANYDSDLPPCALDEAKAMGNLLSDAKNLLYDCHTVERKLRAMVASATDTVTAQKIKNVFMIQVATKIVPKALHCLSMQLSEDYFLLGYQNNEEIDKEKLEDNSLYHYAIISDNILATSVVVNSTVQNAKDPEKHVFHILTDKLNFFAMKMWFLVNAPKEATVDVENIDDFTWLNSSYCSVLRQLESARLREYYFKEDHPSSLSDGSENLKYRNPKYLSILNHLRFYLPEVYPKLDKILFLDDDIVIQKDLTPLWSIDLKGNVNGAVETCKGSFHRFDKYLNFSNPKISKNFDPNDCGWAFGMNIFDLKEWRARNMTRIYHHWQDMNEDRTLWKLGSLPPGLLTFYNLTLPLDRSWHVLGLGYNHELNETDIENAGVIHYNGNYKPWLELAISKYKSYWTKYVMFGNPYFQNCNLSQ